MKQLFNYNFLVILCISLCVASFLAIALDISYLFPMVFVLIICLYLNRDQPILSVIIPVLMGTVIVQLFMVLRHIFVL